MEIGAGNKRSRLRFGTRSTLLVVACLSLLFGAVYAGGAAGDGRDKMSEKLRARVEAGGTEMVDVIVRYKKHSAREKRLLTGDLDIRQKWIFDKLRMRAYRVPANKLEKLAKNKNVEFIAVDAPVKASSLAARQTARVPAYGSYGYVPVNPNLTVAVLDSGVSSTHADLHVAGQVNIVPLQGTCGVSYRDEFNGNGFDGNDGTAFWNGDWVEYDVAGRGPGYGNVTVNNGELFLDDRPNTGTRPSARRAADLSQVTAAEFSFDFRTGPGVEADEDRVAVDISSNGGASYSTLEIFDAYDGAASGSRSYDITPYISDNTVVRFRVYDLYGGPSEYFAVDNVQITAKTAAGACNLSDPFGHGTHVAGVIGGDGTLSNQAYTGVAPGATIYSVRVLDNEGNGLTSDVIAGLNWVLGNAAAYNIKIVNLSLGKGVDGSAAEDPLVQAAEALWDAGITVVTSAGNFGRDGNFTITSPGNSPKVITVGSITDNGTGNDFFDDYVSTYSSQGPTLGDHYLKPDL
ncbi:MAG TPA: hypothetical protein ENJ12_12635, partial [Thiolapillus brandeum]|nr:hypothetical protein [Thiolapillus brandeum]